MTEIETCDCCKKNPSVGVGSIPFLPISIAWCDACLEAQVIPYDMAVMNTVLCGGLEHTNLAWRAYVERTLQYFGKTQVQFEADMLESDKTLQTLEHEKL